MQELRQTMTCLLSLVVLCALHIIVEHRGASQPHTAGFEGVFCPKENEIEGLAVYWRASRYRMVQHHIVRFKELISRALEGDVAPSVAPLLPVIKVD